MRHLTSAWSSYQSNIDNKPLALFLDFDGTLAPIAPTPEEAELEHQNKTLLRKLAQTKNCKVALISGRSLEDLKQKVDIKKAVYVGNHGLEMEWEQINFENFIPPDVQKTISKVCWDMTRQLSFIKGVIIEDKKLSLSVHYRQVDDKDLDQLKALFFEVCRPYLMGDRIEICLGNKVLEVRPFAAVDKSQTIFWLLKTYQEKENKEFFPIFVGDDKTDESTFAQVKAKGLTVVVGEHTSQAEYFLRDTKEVTWLLREILKLSRGEMALAY